MTKHIVFLTPGFPRDNEHSFIIPALQIFVKKLIESNQDLTITIISFQYPFTVENFNWHGANVIPLDGRNKRSKKIIVWLKAYQTLKRINRENKIDLIHSFWIRECSLVGGIFTKKNHIPHIITAMGQDVLANNRYINSYVRKAKIITLSEFQHRFLQDNYGLDSTIIPWGIDSAEFPKTEKRKIDILGVGSLNKVKNYDLFINIIGRLDKRGLKINVEILGEGSLKTQIEKKIELLGLQTVIKVSGQVSREEVLTKMAKAKVLLHTSTFESFGMVFIEALYSGMNVVSNNVGIAKQSPNWEVCDGEIEFEAAVIEALKKENKRTLNYDVIDTANRYKNVYSDLLDD